MLLVSHRKEYKSLSIGEITTNMTSRKGRGLCSSRRKEEVIFIVLSCTNGRITIYILVYDGFECALTSWRWRHTCSFSVRLCLLSVFLCVTRVAWKNPSSFSTTKSKLNQTLPYNHHDPQKSTQKYIWNHFFIIGFNISWLKICIQY